MSRSHRKQPYRGLCADSEKSDKKRWHSLLRYREKQRIRTWLRVHESFENYLPLLKNEVSEPYTFSKDAKIHWRSLCRLVGYLESGVKGDLANDPHFRKFMMK